MFRQEKYFPELNDINDPMQSEKRKLIICWVIILLTGIIHRASLFAFYFNDLNNLVNANPSWYDWHYLSIAGLKDHLFKSILYLQQTPPVPNIIMGIALKLFEWPCQVAYFLIFYTNLISIISALVLFKILCGFNKKFSINAIIAIIFLLSTDLIIMEYNSFGQSFYDNMSMLVLLLIVYFFIKLKQQGTIKYSLYIGILTGFLVLTRSAFSYFFIISLIFMLIMKLSRRHILLYLIPIIILHGGWTLKNYIVYDNFDISTTTWKGLHFGKGLAAANLGKDFKDSILSEENLYNKSFIEMIKKNGLLYFFRPPDFNTYFPDEINKREDEIQQLLSGTNTYRNLIKFKILSDYYLSAYVRYFLKNPGKIFRVHLKTV
jgi:hypothetical protein